MTASIMTASRTTAASDLRGKVVLVTGSSRGLGAAVARGLGAEGAVAADFEKGIVWIKWIGTHRDYDRIDVKEVQHGG